MVVLLGALLFGAGVLATNGIAAAADDPWVPPWAVLCAGQQPTIFAVPGVPTFGDPGGVPTADVILGTPWPDEIHGLGGPDLICGLGGEDRLSGGNGDDRIFGQGDDDDMVGNDGDDILNGGPHNQGDRGDGGLGVDACPLTEIIANC
jgi:Ca2+-binding RTX toxin-like protein